MTVRNLGGGVWEASGVNLERAVVQTDWDNEEAVGYLQHRFDRMGFDALLAKSGVRAGDEVRVLDFAFTYEGAPSEDDFAELDGEAAEDGEGES